MVTFGDANLLKTCLKYNCDFCDYNTCKKSSYLDHLSTDKHKNRSFGDACDAKPANILSHGKKYICELCNKQYTSRNGIWMHKKKCKNNNEYQVEEQKESLLHDKELILMLIKQNTELLEIVKNGTHNTSNSHNHSHNKTFNLQFFLNETCKDAMNITDFVDSIKYKICDLEKMGEIGYVEGLSNIITTNLNALDVTKRPIHCADKKREVIYIKDDDKWEKEEEDKKKLRKVIKRIAHNNSRLLPKYKEIHPDCDGTNSDQYNKMIIEAMGGLGNDDKEKENKIIRNISNSVIIDKIQN